MASFPTSHTNEEMQWCYNHGVKRDGMKYICHIHTLLWLLVVFLIRWPIFRPILSPFVVQVLSFLTCIPICSFFSYIRSSLHYHVPLSMLHSLPPSFNLTPSLSLHNPSSELLQFCTSINPNSIIPTSLTTPAAYKAISKLFFYIDIPSLINNTPTFSLSYLSSPSSPPILHSLSFICRLSYFFNLTPNFKWLNNNKSKER
jgi:hypothetical protein